jgi:hypothetical protein
MDEMEFRAASMDIRAAMNVAELMAIGLTREQADLEMARRVYGDHITRADKIEERGIGSAWSIKHHPEKNRGHFLNILAREGDDAYAAALKAAGLTKAP